MNLAKRYDGLSCERCCFFEFCTKYHRTETKDCVYGRKDEVNKLIYLKKVPHSGDTFLS